jgi:predicted HicB family RNase H-like nuclease
MEKKEINFASKVSKRINLSVPDSVYEELKLWADAQGRSIGNLTAYIVEKAVDDAKAQNKIPNLDQIKNTKTNE